MNKVKNSKAGKAHDTDNVALAIWRFKGACNVLAELVNNQLFEIPRDWYWVGGKPGGVCDFGDTDFLTPEDMVLLLEHKYTYNQYVEWREVNLRHSEKGFISLRSWIMGARHEMFNNHNGHYVK